MLLARVGAIDDAVWAVQYLSTRDRKAEALGVSGELARVGGRNGEAISALEETMAVGRFAPEATYYLAAESLADIWRNSDPLRAIRVLEEASARPFRTYSYMEIGVSGSYFWLRVKVRLGELYRAQGRLKDAEQIDFEVRHLLSAADPDHPLLARLNRTTS